MVTQRYLNIATNIGVSLLMSIACFKSISFITRKFRERSASKQDSTTTSMEVIVNSMIPPPDTILVERIPKAVTINLETKSNVFNQKIKVFETWSVFFFHSKYLIYLLTKCNEQVW